MEDRNLFVSSRGLLKSCDVRAGQPRSSHADIELFDYGRLRPGCTIYICQDAIPLFAEQILQNISVAFTLVSGDSDLALTKQIPGFARITQSPHLQAWYAQNLKALHKKLHPLPIGLDYHTAWEFEGYFEAGRLNPAEQERMLLSLLGAAKPLSERIPKAYCNWHFVMHGNRADCRAKVAASACHYEESRVPRHRTWQTQSDFMFVLSPEGAGMDCHRTWEAMLLGAIPVVNRNAISALFRRLPVVIVDDWSEVTPSFLDKSLAKISSRKFDFSSLFLDGWKRILTGAAPDKSFSNMSFEEFTNTITKLPGGPTQ